MSDDIKPGDLCEVFDACCDTARGLFVGIECRAVERRQGFYKWHCQFCGAGAQYHWAVEGSKAGEVDLRRCPERYLRKKPPKQTDDAEPRVEHVPAEPEFVEDLRRRLSRVPA